MYNIYIYIRIHSFYSCRPWYNIFCGGCLLQTIRKFVLPDSKPHFLSEPLNPSETRAPVQGTRPESAQSITEGATKKSQTSA